MRRRLLNDTNTLDSEFVDFDLPSRILWAKGNLCKTSGGEYYIGNELDQGVACTHANIVGYNLDEGFQANEESYYGTPGDSLSGDIIGHDESHDIITYLFGEPFRLPITVYFQELYDNTDHEYITNYNNSGVNGMKFTKKTDPSIYIFIRDGAYSTRRRAKDKQYVTTIGTLYTGNIQITNNRDRYAGCYVRAIKHPDYSKMPLTILNASSAITSDLPIYFQFVGTGGYYGITIQVSTDGGKTWTNKTSSSNSDGGTLLATITSGQCLQIKGTNNTYDYNSGSIYNQIKINAADNYICGNILSLIYGDNYINNDRLPNDYRTFRYLFSSSYSTLSAENLILPSNVTRYCYDHFFSSCTKLKIAPQLPKNTIANYCYEYMFYNCRSLQEAPDIICNQLATYSCYHMFCGCNALKYLKCTATSVSNTNCTTNWLLDVASSGTFVKNSSMSSWASGVSGIPSGWTVVNAT